jgi:ABC-type uncharacterized transport system substrate-binding protein
LLQATRTVPIVFVMVPDPVGAGFVDSLARPGGNATGFLAYEYSLGAKWLELLKELAPRVTRAAVLRDSALASGPGQFAAIQSMAPSLGVELTPSQSAGSRDAFRISVLGTCSPKRSILSIAGMSFHAARIKGGGVAYAPIASLKCVQPD